LESLILIGTKVTDAGDAELQKELPGLDSHRSVFRVLHGSESHSVPTHNAQAIE